VEGDNYPRRKSEHNYCNKRKAALPASQLHALLFILLHNHLPLSAGRKHCVKDKNDAQYIMSEEISYADIKCRFGNI
jgi:hypothetical protein